MVITIDTGYQNRPSFITGSRAHSVLWQARDPGGGDDLFFFFFCLSAQHPQSDRVYLRGVQYCNRVCIWMFLVRYIMTGCIFRAPSAIWQGQVLTPPPPSGTPLSSWEVECPPPPPRGIMGINAASRTRSRANWHREISREFENFWKGLRRLRTMLYSVNEEVHLSKWMQISDLRKVFFMCFTT